MHASYKTRTEFAAPCLPTIIEFAEFRQGIDDIFGTNHAIHPFL